MIILGLDLGQAADPSAVVAVERLTLREELNDVYGQPVYYDEYRVRHAQRFPLGLSYARIADDVVKMVATPRLKNNYRLAVDATGVGRPVIDMLRERDLIPVPVVITSGLGESLTDEGFWNVSKRELVSFVQSLLGHGHLKFAGKLPDKQTMIKELQNFKMKFTATGNDTYEAWRSGDHDDLVLALCIACWLAKRAKSGTAPKDQWERPLSGVKNL